MLLADFPASCFLFTVGLELELPIFSGNDISHGIFSLDQEIEEMS